MNANPQSNQPIKIVLKEPEKGYGKFDLRKIIPSGASRERTAWNIAGLFVIFLLIGSSIYGWYWLQTDRGQRFLTSAGSVIKELSPAAMGEKFVKNIKSMTSWETEDNPEKPEQGVILKSIEAIGSKNIPQGNDILLRYNIKVEGTDKSIPTDIYCKIKEKNITGAILPTERIVLSKNVPTSIRCRIPGSETEDLIGPQIIEAGGSFEFKTEDVYLPVYITYEETYTQAVQNGKDFFRFYNIPETQPIKAMYNGEPVEIAIGVSDENIQPVTIGEGITPFVGIALKNRWSGKIQSLTKLELSLPKEIRIDDKLSPKNLCPFAFTGTRSLRNIYQIPDEYLDEMDFKKDEAVVFECFLQIDPSIVGDGLYAKTKYQASAEYVYSLNPKTETVTIKS